MPAMGMWSFFASFGTASASFAGSSWAAQSAHCASGAAGLCAHRAPPFAEAALWAAGQVPESCDRSDDADCPYASDLWQSVASAWRYAWNNLRLAIQHASPAHRLRLTPREVQQVVAVHEFMYWLGNDAKKWHVGWPEMSSTARALLRSLQLWLVAGEYQLGSHLSLTLMNHALHIPFAGRSVQLPAGDTGARVSLSNGLPMPLLVFSVWNVWKFPLKTNEVYKRVLGALRAGYRHIDIAPHYGSEKEVSMAIRDSGVQREQIFLTSKLGARDGYPLGAKRAILQQLKHFGLDYIDLFMLSQPIQDSMLLRSVWEVLEAFYDKGIFRSLGVSNFDMESFQALHHAVRVKPVYLQCRMSIYQILPEDVNSEKSKDGHMLGWTREHGVVMSAFHVEERFNFLRPLEDPHVLSIAKRAGRSASAVLARWALQLGLAVVPKEAEERTRWQQKYRE
ncbi:YPR1 [Symbiodinium natans]|uniref:YPR1 protein n=1 Tax=Symbiodinium natans TaxID=878477 RepID=A0A812V0G8_9DINO|nr:YPR1 [Symbiodinium natans]